MPSSDTQRVLTTIAYHIELARRFVDGMSYDDFVADERTRYAVTRWPGDHFGGLSPSA